MNKTVFTYKKSGVNIDSADKFVNFISKLSSKNKGDNSLDPYVLDEFQLFLKSVISEIFDKKKSFVSL